MITQLVELTCDAHLTLLCDESIEFATSSILRAFKYARANGWHISHDRKKAYCPNCVAARKKSYYGRKGHL